VRPELEDTAQQPAPEPAPAAPAAPAPAAPDRTATAISYGRPIAPPSLDLPPGRQLGHFRIERRLGAGGMGEVYLATDLALDRPVAVKVLPEALARDPKLRERLVREARAQARVVHPNVAHIYFIGEDAGRLFFAMEHLAGETLAERIARGPVSVDEALAAIRAAALGLREAQRSGFTHRDVKPSNLMLDAHGVLKVLDFGLAADAPDPNAAGGPVAQTSLAGTPLYMAPEQARGDAVDLRADIYALGVTLFHLVSGRPPFVADTANELLTLHASADRPAVPRRGQPRTRIAAIDALCARMMAPRPADRFATYDELLRAIDIASTAHTRPAGFWVRAIATGIDFMLVGAAVAGVFALVALLGGGSRDEMPATLLALAVYEALAVARWGTTAGKAVFELEVADVTTLGKPPLARAARRAAAILGAPALVVSAAQALAAGGLEPASTAAEIASLLAMPLGLGLLLHATIRTAGKRAVWDRLAGTMVRYRTARPTGAL
jgi:tRNA A-37 threonylcarbamoyl transferase component Bud32/uncharacterized RDD family membrane protein YckC